MENNITLVNKILVGDAVTQLKKIPDEVIQCVVTSPPYYGLRDYGTREWVGGKDDCEHHLYTPNEREIKGWTRPSRKENRKVYNLWKCAVCSNSFKSRVPSAFCSRECLNVLNNDNRHSASPKRVDQCSMCGAKCVDNQIGLETTPEEYVDKLVAIFEEVKRVLTPDGTVWLNLGDSYTSAKSRTSSIPQTIANKKDRGDKHNKKIDLRGHHYLKDKDLIGIPWRVAFALQKAGWYLRQDIVWSKPNCMPESVRDRCTKAHEYIFLLTKSHEYFYDQDAIKEISIDPESFKGIRRRNIGKMVAYDPIHYNKIGSITNYGSLRSGQTYPLRNKRSVWHICTSTSNGAHFATFPEELPKICIKAGTRKGDIVLDPFMGSGTVAVVARKLDRDYIGIELNPLYAKLIKKRLKSTGMDSKKLYHFVGMKKNIG